VSADGLVTAKENVAIGSATIRATVANATAYFGEKQISVEVILDTIQNAFTPANGAKGVALDAALSLAFNQSVEVANAAAITVNDVPVQAAVVANNVVTLTPAEALVNDSAYTVSVPVGAIKDATSTLVNASGYAWTFRTVKPDPTEVHISGGNTVVVGEELQLTAEVLPENAIVKDVTWSVESGTAVTVDENGKVAGVSAGIAVVKATVTGYPAVYDTYEVTVTAAQTPPTAVARTSVTAVMIYPNPVKKTLHIVNNGGYTTAQIVDASGTLRRDFPIAAGKTSIDVGFLSSGIYFVKLSASKTKPYTVKLIVERGI
jgi:hypothetical protein